jgi:hypothetical protein
MNYTRTTISWDLIPQTPIVQLDTGRDTVEGDFMSQIGEMLSLVRTNWERFQHTLGVTHSLDEWEQIMKKDHPEPGTFDNEKGEWSWDEDSTESFISTFDHLVDILSGGDYHAFVDGEMNGFYVFDGPYIWDPSDGEDNVIEEIRTGEWGSDAFPTMDAAIVGSIEKMEHEGTTLETFVNTWGSYYHVKNYHSETRTITE